MALLTFWVKLKKAYLCKPDFENNTDFREGKITIYATNNSIIYYDRSKRSQGENHRKRAF